MDEDCFKRLWDRCVRDEEERMGKSWLERHLSPLSLTALDFHVKKSQCFLLLQARENVNQNKKPEAAKSFHEKWLRSKDSLVVGRADEIRFNEAGATIVDYKTGSISGQSFKEEVLSEYQEQLKLYAALFHEEHEEWPNNLIVIGLDGKSHCIDYEKNECLILLEESKNMLQRVNSIIADNMTSGKPTLSKLASPSQTKCRYCLYRPICEPYFLMRQSNSAEGWPNDAWGVVAEKRILQNGLGKIVLIPLQGSFTTNIRGLRLERHGALGVCQKIGVFSLCSDNSENNYKEGQFTTIYGIE
jgi:CRISPR/Cas system-associated exonuclease Cas4 (RecB family)